MGEKEVLMEVVEKTRKEMRDAQDAATKTPRPVDACPSHDALFALTKAQTNALDTLLMLKQEEMRENAAEDQPVVKGGLKATLTTALVANMKTAIITVGLVAGILGLAIIFTRQISEAAGFVDTTAQAAHGGSK